MEKALIFGAHSPRNLLKRKMTLDASVLARKFGIELEYVAISELIEQYDEIGDRRVGQLGTVQEAADELVGGALPRDLSEAPPRTEVENAVRLYLAMSEIIEQRSAAAAAIVCAPFIQSPEHPTPCIALGLLQDRGIPAACQGDLEALVTMMVLHKIAGKPSYMGNVFRDNRTVVLSHCVMARKLLGLDDPDPNTAGIDSTELPGYIVANKENELSGHSRAVAAELLAVFADSLQGRVASVVPKNGLKLKGNMAAATLQVGAAPSAKVSAVLEFPGQQKPISRLALMPEATRHIVLGIVPFGKGDK